MSPVCLSRLTSDGLCLSYILMSLSSATHDNAALIVSELSDCQTDFMVN